MRLMSLCFAVLLCGVFLVAMLPGCGLSKDNPEGQEQRETSINTFESIEGGAKAVEPWIPAPWGQVLIGAIGTIGTGLGLRRAAQNKEAGINLAHSTKPIVDRAMTEHSDTAKYLRAAQSPRARHFVDIAQGKTKSLPF